MLCSHKSLPSPTVITGLDTQETQPNTENPRKSSEDWQRKFSKLTGGLFLSLEVASIPSQAEIPNILFMHQHIVVIEYHSDGLLPDNLGR